MSLLYKAYTAINELRDMCSRRDERGQTMVEYVMLIVLVALAVFIVMPNIKDAILKVFQNTSSALA